MPMQRRMTRVLLVEDEDVDAEVVRRDLAGGGEGGPLFRLDHVVALAQGIDRLAKGGVDVVLLDLHLPDSWGVETVRRLREHDALVPIVVFTVAGDETTAAAALASGAQDYLVKDELGGSLLRRTIRHAIERRRISAEKERLERLLRRAERMESLGALSAGIGFGLNNVLGAIFDRSDEALASLDAPGQDIRLRTALLEIRRAASQGAEMVAHLRDYAAGEAERGELDLSRFVIEGSRFLDSIVPRSVEVAYDVSGDSLTVEIEKSELHRVLMSLIVNAAEVMAGRPGSIAISTGTLVADEGTLLEAWGWWDPQPGLYAFLRVAASGPGIDVARKDRIFDPFHDAGLAGRALGLAGVIGILQRHRAVLRVDPRQPSGLVFTILFPQLGPRSPARR